MSKNQIITEKEYKICESTNPEQTNCCDFDPTQIEEEINVFVDNDKMKVTQIVSRGAISPAGFWYDQAESEFIYMLKGIGVIEFEDGSEERLNKGSTVYIAPHLKHRVTYASIDAVWLCVYSR